MIRLVSPRTATPPRVLDPRYVGDAVSQFQLLASTSAGRLDTGVWRFQGSHETPVHTGYDEILLILEGELTIESADASVVATAGDVVIYEPPIAPQRLSSPGGILAVYVIHSHADD